MSIHDDDLIERLHAMVGSFDMPATPLADDLRRGRRRVRRTRAMVAGTAAAAVAVILGATAALGRQDGSGTDGTDLIDRPGLVVGAVPVWYDSNGLHRGDVVEQVPVEIFTPEEPVGDGGAIPAKGSLALVRTGAMYSDTATGDVWFHPWGGEPRIVGHDSAAGPGGDPNSDIAVWFEGSEPLNATPGELVVYDTATGREISRTSQRSGVSDCSGSCGDHYPAGNGFLQVSAEHVVWNSAGKMWSFDVRTWITSEVEGPYRFDIQGGVEAMASDDDALLLKVRGQGDREIPALETHVRVSPSGNYLLAVEGTEARHAAAIWDIRADELWRLPINAYPWIAWSYDDIALVDTEEGFIACAAAQRTCESLDTNHVDFLMPTN